MDYILDNYGKNKKGYNFLKKNIQLMTKKKRREASFKNIISFQIINYISNVV